MRDPSRGSFSPGGSFNPRGSFAMDAKGANGSRKGSNTPPFQSPHHSPPGSAGVVRKASTFSMNGQGMGDIVQMFDKDPFTSVGRYDQTFSTFNRSQHTLFIFDLIQPIGFINTSKYHIFSTQYLLIPLQTRSINHTFSFLHTHTHRAEYARLKADADRVLGLGLGLGPGGEIPHDHHQHRPLRSFSVSSTGGQSASSLSSTVPNNPLSSTLPPSSVDGLLANIGNDSFSSLRDGGGGGSGEGVVTAGGGNEEAVSQLFPRVPRYIPPYIGYTCHLNHHIILPSNLPPLLR